MRRYWPVIHSGAALCFGATGGALTYKWGSPYWVIIATVFGVCLAVILGGSVYGLIRKYLPTKANEEGDIVTITADIKENLAKIQALVDRTRSLTEFLELQAAALISQAEAPAKRTRKPKAEKSGRKVQVKAKAIVPPVEKKRGGRPKGSLNKRTLAKMAEQAAATQGVPAGDDGDGPDRCVNCGNLVPECVCTTVQATMAAVDKR